MSTVEAGAHPDYPPRVADLLLVRLLTAGKKGLMPDDVRKQFAAFLPKPLSDAAVAALRRDLADRGWLESSARMRLTDVGRARALGILGIERLPPRASWAAIQARYLFPLARGVSPGDAAARDRLAKAKSRTLLLMLLKQHFGLEDSPATTAKQVIDAAACKLLGFPGVGDLPTLRSAVMSRALSLDEPLKPKDLDAQVPRLALRVRSTSADELRRAAIRQWLAGGATPAFDKAFDLPAFAAAAVRAARTSPGGRFGDNKVFISHAWRRFRDDWGGPALDLPAFKARLIEASTGELLRLSRADLPAAMDPDDVRESEVRYLNSEFHFILLGRDRS